MSPMKPITQSRFIHGLSATFGIFSQPDGTVPRSSNLVMTRRGSLITCGGSQLLARSHLAGSILQGTGPMWLELFLFQQLGAFTTLGTRQVFGLLHAYNQSNGNFEVTLVALPLISESFPSFDASQAPSLIYNFGGTEGVSLLAIDSAMGGVGGGGGGYQQGTFKTALQFPSVPMILQFTNEMVICLGSGTNPYVSDGTSGGTFAVFNNTFSAQYPSWQANVAFPQGSLIQVQFGSTYNVFKAIQGGVTGSSQPSFPANLHATVADGTIVWQNVAPLTTSPVPRGAAHGISYAGSLWLANTFPTPTTDGLDGPSAIRMSDINNYSSWNPLNGANLGLGDGTEITGLAVFTIAEVGISPTGSLMVFKQFTTYQIIGVFGSTSLTIQPLQTDLGCVAPRSIQFIPGFGIMRLSHLGFAITNGVVDKLACEEIRPYIFGSVNVGGAVDIPSIDWNFAWFSKAAQTADPPMYVCACPVIGGVPLGFLSGVSASRVFIATAFGGQTWYCRVSAFSVTHLEFAVSSEFGPFVLDQLNGLQVTTPAYPPGAVSFQLYVYQKSANGEPIAGAQIAIPASATTIVRNFFSYLPGNPPSGWVGALTRLFCFDLVLKAWAIVDLPWPIAVLKQFRMHGSVPITVSGGYNDQTVRRILMQDSDWDGQPIAWSVQGREVFGEGGSQEIFMRRLIIRGYGQSAANRMVIYPTYDGNNDPGHVVGETVQVTNLGQDQFEARLDLQRIARNVHVLLTGQGQVELTALDYEIEPCEVGAPIVIA